MADDPRHAAARYRHDRDAEAAESAGAPPAATAAPDVARAFSAADRAAVVETAIQQAIRRGEFDELPGAGKPIPGLGEHHDPDWWIRRKIESEQLTGLGPPALMLRAESAGLAERLDSFVHEHEVREAVADFNHRVIEARRQLLGGPPVVTATRDLDAEVVAWRERAARRAAAVAAPADAAPPPRRWWRRD